MSVSVIKLRTAGPVMFRAPGEFSPTARGPEALARSLPLPTPSTIAGCLATAIGGRPRGPIVSWDEGVEDALELGARGFLRGPYLTANGEVYVSLGDGVINVGSLRVLEQIDIFDEFKRISFFDELRERKELPLKSLHKHLQSIKRIPRVGIGLEEGKIVDRARGLMYLAEFVDYEATFEGKEVSIAIEAHNISLRGASGRLMRFGGEGGVVSIEVVEDERRAGLWSCVKKLLESPPTSLYLYLMTFGFIDVLPPEPELLSEGAWLSPGLTHSVRALVRKLTNGRAEVEYVVGETCLLGAGFDLARGTRKPSYVALRPGTIVKVRIEKDPRATIHGLYEKGLSTVGGRLGYGTFIPLCAPR